MIWAFLYIGAIVLANVTVSVFGPVVTPINAFFLIGATLTLRDVLHERYGPRVVVVLIPLGTLISLALGPGVARIALAGALAFLVSELVDTGVYHVGRDQEWWRRALGSNIAGAAVDSVLFPTLAFGAWMPLIAASQFIAKTTGGALWVWMLHKTWGKK